MDNPYRMLPPMGALVGFEAAARLGSFSLAAEELNMTQSAISHQVRTLETHLQQPLFLRINRRVELTDAGHDLQKTAETVLETFRHGVRRLEAYSKPGSVVIHMPPSLGAMWFVPRLGAFLKDHPNVDPWLFTTNTEFDLTQTEVDIAITQYPKYDDEIIYQLFFTDKRLPLASPDLADLYSENLEKAPLLHDESAQDWQKWFLLANQSREDYAQGPNFSDIAMMLEAAANGLGVCLGSAVLAEPMIKAGRLVPLSDIALDEDAPFYLVTLERNLQRSGVRHLWNWLQNKAAHGVGMRY